MTTEANTPLGNDAILCADQVAEILMVHKSTILGAARRGEIPCRRVGRLYRFSRAAIMRWLADAPAVDPPPNERRSRHAPTIQAPKPFVPKPGSIAWKMAQKLASKSEEKP